MDALGIFAIFGVQSQNFVSQFRNRAGDIAQRLFAFQA